MQITSIEANKLINSLISQKEILLNNERKAMTFDVATTEDVEECRPNYNYYETHDSICRIDWKIMTIRHALNVFNCTTIIKEFDITIDQALILIPLLRSRMHKYTSMANNLEKERTSWGPNSPHIVYRYTNYLPIEAEKHANHYKDYLNGLEIELYKINNTLTFEVDI